MDDYRGAELHLARSQDAALRNLRGHGIRLFKSDGACLGRRIRFIRTHLYGGRTGGPRLRRMRSHEIANVRGKGTSLRKLRLYGVRRNRRGKHVCVYSDRKGYIRGRSRRRPQTDDKERRYPLRICGYPRYGNCELRVCELLQFSCNRYSRYRRKNRRERVFRFGNRVRRHSR